MSFNIELLSWNYPKDKQDAYIEALLNQKDFDFTKLIQPIGKKDCWDNCAKILSNLPDKILIPYLSGLLRWLKDLNWPGAQKILDRLKLFADPSLKEAFEAAVKHAIDDEDEEWLDYLSALIENENLAKLLNNILIAELTVRYNNFWGK